MNARRRDWLLATMAASIVAFPATPGLPAQTPYTLDDIRFLEPGTRVRITTNDQRFVGVFESAGDDSISVASGSAEVLRTLVLSSMNQIEVSRGRTRGSRTAASIGALVGLAAGIAYAAAECSRYEGNGEICTSAFLVLPATFGLGGTILGWGVGMAFVTDEKWLPVSTDSSPSSSRVTTHGGVELTLTLRLKL